MRLSKEEEVSNTYRERANHLQSDAKMLKNKIQEFTEKEKTWSNEKVEFEAKNREMR